LVKNGFPAERCPLRLAAQLQTSSHSML